MNDIDKTACFTGHRPNKLGGYDLTSPKNIKIFKETIEVIESLILNENIDTFITGGALGFDQIAFLGIDELKQRYKNIKSIMAVPFKAQACKWPPEDAFNYYLQKLAADEVVYVDEIEEYKVPDTIVGQYHIIKMQKRNMFMVDNSRIIISCWDGSAGGTGNCIKYAESKSKTMINILKEKI